MIDPQRDCADIHDPLRLDRCPDCGYLLCGLPARGLCPECGFAYDPSMIVLYGWEKGRSRHRWARWHRWWSLAGGAPAPVQVRLTPTGYGLRDGIGPVTLRPWQRAMGVNFEPIRPGWQLLYSEYNGQRVAWWDGLEICCDEQTAWRIRQRVARWCAEAQEPAK